MEHRNSNLIEDEEETMATPRFDAPAAEPKRVVPLERIRTRTASAVRRVRHRVRPSGSERAPYIWLSLIAMFLLAGVAGGYFLATDGEAESADDAPIVRSELEAEPGSLNVDTKKSAFAEKDDTTPGVQDSAEFTPVDSAPAAETSASQPDSKAQETKLLTVEDEPEISTEVELREDDKQTSKQSDQRRENERLELIRKDAERQAARELEERNRLRREQTPKKEQQEKSDSGEQNKKPESAAGSDSEKSADLDRF